jgi:S-adenosylmethionine hydrolase
MAIIALMTDFGTRDHYVAAMKGMILQIDPKATLVDITHEIEPQEIVSGAFILRQAFPYFPVGTIFLAVVDPTVGTSRRILAARYSDRIVLAPDNGLLTLIHRDAEVQEVRVVDNRRLMAASLSSTFHGRDIFAPVAGHLSKGVSLGQVGPAASQVLMLELAKPVYRPNGGLDGEVLFIDRFGNLIPNISELDLSAAHSRARQHRVAVGSHEVGPIQFSYADVPQGKPIALIGSTQMLEIAVNGGSAAATLDAHRGTPIHVRAE